MTKHFDSAHPGFLEGRRVTRIRRAFWVFGDEPINRSEGPLELAFEDGDTILFDEGPDETLLRIVEASLDDGLYGMLAINSRDEADAVLGGYFIEDVTAEVFRDAKEVVIMRARPVHFSELVIDSDKRECDDVVGIVITMPFGTVRAVTGLAATGADGLLVEVSD